MTAGSPVSISDVSATDAAPAPSVAIVVPCYNEEISVGRVVEGFRAALPDAEVYIYDNNSTDRTAEVARAAGAQVRTETRQGKGNVVRRMFADTDADIVVMVDGDDTYDASSAPVLIDRLIADDLDMVIGTRLQSDERAAFRSGHRFGNRMLTNAVNYLFGAELVDILSGYRVMSRRFVKSFPALSSGFETETELTIHALELKLPIAEVETPYAVRPEGSFSKLNTWRDGFRILRTIVKLVREFRPVLFYGTGAAVLAAISILLAWPVFTTYLETGLVPRLPTAILATGIMLLAFLSATSGLILENVSRGRWEQKRMAYLAHRSVRSVMEQPDHRQV
jgi:glycosyltransferase involved in cell wall biosynthesis